jgi:murein DD-endopeptidase MepM/ murein hydrolase activator NlpD
MAGRGRIAVGTGLFMFGLTVAASVELSSAAPGPTTRVAETAAPLAESVGGTVVSMRDDTRVEAIRDELDSIDAQLAKLTAALSTLTESVRMSDPDIQRARRELNRLARDAEEAALPASLTAAASVATASALIEPLQTVSSAIQSKDSYVAALLRALAAAHREEVSLGDLAETARFLRFELELRMNELDLLLSHATQARSDVEDGDSLPLESVRLEIGRTQELFSVAQRADIDLRMLSIRLATHRDKLVEQLRRTDARGEVLLGAMATVEAFVGHTFPGLPLSGATPVVEGVLHVCPVDQPHSYTDDFGAPRWAGGYHPHQGNDIFAPEGTPIRAPFDGLAVQTPNTLGGRAVTVYGGAGFAYNAHLSEYGTLGKVTTGTIIGYVGNSGDAVNSASHNHFEWHPDNGTAVDPFPYLNAVCLLPSDTTSDTSSS